MSIQPIVKEKKTVLLPFRCSLKEREELKTMAKACNKTVSNYIRDLIKQNQLPHDNNTSVHTE